MTKRFSTAVLTIAFVGALPLSAHAAWWNPFSWGRANSSVEIQTMPVGISTSKLPATPSVADLEMTIASLQSELADALAKIDTLTRAASSAKPVASTPVASTASASTRGSTGLSQSAIIARVKPAIVTISTATSSGTGVVIDSSGDILTNAHVVWTTDRATGNVIGAANQISVTYMDGTRATANLVGIDEARDLAVLELASEHAFAYVRVNYDTGLALGQSAYVFSLPAINGGSTGGQAFIAGTVSQKTADTIELTSDIKPLDTGGAMINDAGGLIGLPNRSNCKVIQDMTTCLKYTVTANVIRTALPKLLAGMQLYKQKAGESAEEIAVRGQLQNMYQNVSQGSVIDFAVSNVSGNNNFDYFNKQLLGTTPDTDPRLINLYLMKLRQVADTMYQASDFLKQQAYALNVFFQTDSGPISNLGSYERAVIAKFQSANAAKLVEYEAKVAYWSHKKNEYDGYINNPSGVTHDYLMAEGAYEEAATNYFIAEKQRIMNAFSGEDVAIF